MFFALALAVPDARGQAPGPSLRGFLDTHDPSTIIKCKDRYYTFYTGQGILSKWSTDKIFWSAGPPVFSRAPAWTTNAVPGFAGVFWAPDILFFNSRYYLYYAVSTWGSQVSAIGLATNPTLDPADPAYQWTDQGIVIQSGNGSPYNTIDPSFVWDAVGNLWMAFGSYWSGIYLVQLDPQTGLRISSNSPTYQLAYNSSIEASYVWRRGAYYYLFVNWGSCCSGVNSTYNIRVGRSTSVTGPYLDRNGVNLVNGGGTLFLRGTGKFTGPGHVGILSEGGTQWLSYHYYDANAWAPWYNAFGPSALGFVPLGWTADNWPVYTNDWSAIYNFQADARDENGQYYGLLQNGASIQNDPARGHVLNLNGAGQYVSLPPGAAYGQTFAAVVNWRGGGPWQRIFDFGFDTSKTVMLTPASGDNVLRCDINPGGNLQILQWTRPLPSNVWTHVALTLDGTRGVLYVNGAAVATNATMNLLPVDVAPQTNHLGRSKFIADPYFNGQYASFRVYGRALSAAEIVAPVPVITNPRNGSTYQPGDSVTFSGSANDFAAAAISSTGLTWTVSWVGAGATNVVLGPLSGVTNANFNVPQSGAAATSGWYQVSLAAVDGAGRRATNTTTIYPAPPANGGTWASFYPFTTGAQDASNVFNGTLQGGATIVNDPLEGSVVNLSGAGQFVNLPAAAAAAETVAAWVNWRGGNAWQRLFDFGSDTQHWFFLTPKTGSGVVQCAITTDAPTYNRVVELPTALPLNQWTHVAVVMDGRQGILYVNGQAMAVNNSVNLLPADVTRGQAYLGKSHYPADPYLNAMLDSVALNCEPLSTEELRQAFLRPALTARSAGAGLTLSWPQWSQATLHSATGLTAPVSWVPVTNAPAAANGLWSVALPTSEAARFYRLQWP